jgi:HD-GYP domain-containing protein (c-di-GMP phosphodiesterase class II)
VCRVAFTALLLSFGFGLIAFNYIEARRIALIGADDQLERIVTHMRTSVAKLYVPAQNLIDISSKILPSEERSLDSRQRSLSYLAEALDLAPGISSVFVGYDNGDFFLVRPVTESRPAGRDLDAPSDAQLVVQSIERRSETEVKEQLLFFGDDLELLERRGTAWSGFDPRQRDWFRSASASQAQVVSEFYVFFTTREVGVTIARQLEGGRGVVGADLSLSDLSAGLARQRITPSARIAMLEPDGGVIALSDPQLQHPVASEPGADTVEMPHLSQLDDPVYRQLAKRISADALSTRMELNVDGRVWLVSLSALPVRSAESLLLANIVPRDELLADAARVRDQSVLISLGLLVVALFFVIGVSRNVSGSLRTLAGEAEDIRKLKFDTPLTVRSRIKEVDDLARTMAVMKSAVQRFLEISRALSAEKEFEGLLEMILDEARRVSGAQGGAILLRGENADELELATLQLPSPTAAGNSRTSAPEGTAVDPPRGGTRSVDHETSSSGAVVKIDDPASEHDYDLREVRARFDGVGAGIRSVLSLPLRTQQGEVIGVLQLVNARRPSGEPGPFRDEVVPYMEALSSNAAVALDNRRLLKAQRELLDSFIHVVAGAIDAKSPYTHGHCQRVPVLARMLAEAAHESADGAFTEFRLTEDEWYELHLASWLHDCGKVTTPEYVVDKATKLETIHNRIHEIRMRFEVLWRDAELEYQTALRDGTADPAQLHERLQRQLEQIRDDYEFIAQCNLGDEPVSEDQAQRVRRIATQSWMRHLDDRSGLSHGELLAYADRPRLDPPVAEPLLADRPEHIVPRPEGAHPFGDNAHAFRMDMPEHLYNRGEVYNLCIPRGTLTAEERFKINEHIIQTLRMLGRLPFPREMRRVPDWAANHHEKLDGTGYPRRLSAEELSTPERIMAIADIFEALTAVDRPYTRPKPLSRVMRIMVSMCTSGHLCPELFGLFLRSGVHRRYAEEHLRPEQVDAVDVEAILATLASVEKTGS